MCGSSTQTGPGGPPAHVHTLGAPLHGSKRPRELVFTPNRGETGSDPWYEAWQFMCTAVCVLLQSLLQNFDTFYGTRHLHPGRVGAVLRGSPCWWRPATRRRSPAALCEWLLRPCRPRRAWAVGLLRGLARACPRARRRECGAAPSPRTLPAWPRLPTQRRPLPARPRPVGAVAAAGSNEKVSTCHFAKFSKVGNVKF